MATYCPKTMARQDFEATQGLLEDDVRKQAGSIEKSWLEAVMNSVDAGASQVSIDISEDKTVITDDGSGMTEDEIDLYFRQFGFKDSDVEDKTFGRFRRGRGQIFNFGVNLWHTQDNILVVNIEDDETTLNVPHLDKNSADDGVLGFIEDEEEEFDLKEGDAIFDTTGLAYNHQKSFETFDGTKIEVYHFKDIQDVDEKVGDFKKLVRYISWMHSIEVVINGEEIDNSFSPDKETDEAYFQFGKSRHFADATVYNLGAYVTDIRIKDRHNNRIPISSVIVTKKELNLNNARNDIIDGDPVWEKIEEDYIGFAKEEIANRDDPSDREVKWLIKQCQEDDHLYQEIKNEDLLKDINGDPVSLDDLENSKFSFAPSGNAIAREAMDRKGIIMVDEKFETAVSALPSYQQAQDYSDVVDDSFNFEMKERSEDQLSKRRKENLDKIRWFLKQVSCYDTVKAGYSKHENVWRDDKGTIFIDEDFLNKKKNVFLTTVLDRVVEIAAHDGDTRREINKNSSYYRQYHRYMNESSEARRKLIEGTWQNIDDRSFQ